MTTLFAGPCASEFGWALATWAPHLRWRAAQLRATDPTARVVIGAPADTHHLYSDFADELIDTPVEPGSSDFLSGRWISSCHDPWLARVRLGPDDTLLYPDSAYGRALVQSDLRDFRSPTAPLCAPDRKLWHRYGRPTERDPRLIALAFRPPKTLNGRSIPDKAWPAEMCCDLTERLLERGYDVVYVGGRDNWAPVDVLDKIEGQVLDGRGAPLSRQCDTIAVCALTVGPSSAPLHLSQLCGTPVVTWYAYPVDLGARYDQHRGHWNPFRVPARIVAEGRHPSVDDVLRAVLDTLAAQEIR